MFTSNRQSVIAKIQSKVVALLATALLVISLFAIATIQTHETIYAQAANPADMINTIDSELKKQGNYLPTYQSTNHPKASTEQGISNISNAIYFLIEFLRYVIGSIAVLLIVISGIRLVAASDDIDEVQKKEKTHLLYSALSLVLIIIADPIVKTVFFGESGEVLTSQASAQQFAQQGGELIQKFYRLAQSVLGAVAVLVFVYSGVQYALSAGNDDTQGQARRRILWGSAGIVLIGISELVVFDIVFPNNGTQLPALQRAGVLIKDITNFASAFIGTLSVVAIIYAGYLYVTAGVKEENVETSKKVIFAAVIGILLAASAFALANTLLGGLNLAQVN